MNDVNVVVLTTDRDKISELAEIISSLPQPHNFHFIIASNETHVITRQELIDLIKSMPY